MAELDQLDESERTDGMSENGEKIEEFTKQLKKQQRRKEKVAAVKSFLQTMRS